MRTIYSNYARSITVLMLSALTALLVSCGGSGNANTTGTSAASLSLTSTGTSIQSDGSNSVTITATVLTSSNAVLADQTVNFTANSGQLSTSTGVTDANGVVTVTFFGGPSGINRTAAITATSGTLIAQIDIFVSGSTISANPTSASVPDDGSNPLDLTFTALNSSGIAVPYAAFTLAQSGVGSTGSINFTPTAGTADSLGKFNTTVTGVTQGDIALVANALGTTGSASISVTPASAAFNISGLQRNGTALLSTLTAAFSATTMSTADTLTVEVTAPAASSVNFVSTLGTWASTGTNIGQITTPPFTDVLTPSGAGINNVQVLDPLNANSSDTLTVSVSATTPNSITLQASPTIIPRSVSGTTGTSSLIATVKDATNQPVGGVPVAFSIVNPTGGGESISPVVAYTATSTSGNLSLGQAMTTFTSGALSSGQSGVQIRAQVLGTAVVTSTAPSGADAAVVIGGTAGSVAFAQATSLSVTGNGTQYVLAMSVTVADSNGNPAPEGTVVNLSLWPIAWSTGSICTPDADTPTTGTFLNEDLNENLVLDALPVEDGYREYLAGGTVPGGTIDGSLTPANSVAGTVPATVTTDANGMATFNLTYPKTSAIWTVVRIRGSTTVMGGWNAVGQQVFRLAALEGDAGSTCRLPNSQFNF